MKAKKNEQGINVCCLRTVSGFLLVQHNLGSPDIQHVMISNSCRGLRESLPFPSSEKPKARVGLDLNQGSVSTRHETELPF